MPPSEYRYRRISPRRPQERFIDTVLQWRTVEMARIADGSEFVLTTDGEEWVVRVGERILMSNLMYNSEIELARRAIGRAHDPQTVLVGGLGMGFTLRAALDCLAVEAEVTVAELVPELVDWNRKHLGELNDCPLDDLRCRVVIGDVFDAIKRSRQAFDVILLDVDNGPQALAQPKNQRLYSDRGIRACHAALRPGGILAVWSRGPNARYERRLRQCDFEVDVQSCAARRGSATDHVIFFAKATTHS